jgi:hypothetical protein
MVPDLLQASAPVLISRQLTTHRTRQIAGGKGGFPRILANGSFQVRFNLGWIGKSDSTWDCQKWRKSAVPRLGQQQAARLESKSFRMVAV